MLCSLLISCGLGGATVKEATDIERADVPPFMAGYTVTHCGSHRLRLRFVQILR